MARPPWRSLGVRSRRATALAVSIALHLAAFVFAFSGAAGSLVSAAGASGGPTGPVFTVTVVPLSSLSSAAQERVSESEPLFARLRAAKDGVPLAAQRGDRPTDLASLVQRVQRDATSAQLAQSTRVPSAEGHGSPIASPARSSTSQRSSDGQQADADGDASGAASTGRLWGAVEPCWRNLGARGRVPVVLEVALDGSGGLRTPPKVIRSTTAIVNEPRLQAEAGALAAVAACAPRGDLSLGGRTYRLEFPAAP
ncbi:hypothetical protein [Phenylobacterium sp.]|uniref:hypothetical protein n=1 Tax=Phenylobacterium sp. TaxID=1871053 RepID=UPI002E2EEE17|nr:hypothetical protein [Phenylobacterium sp.]HEX4712060.1 hypothetical protein [Phenylobacterium sp.]